MRDPQTPLWRKLGAHAKLPGKIKPAQSPPTPPPPAAVFPVSCCASPPATAAAEAGGTCAAARKNKSGAAPPLRPLFALCCVVRHPQAPLRRILGAHAQLPEKRKAAQPPTPPPVTPPLRIPLTSCRVVLHPQTPLWRKLGANAQLPVKIKPTNSTSALFSFLSWAAASPLQESCNNETGAMAQLWVKALRCQRDAPAACLARPKSPNARGKEDDGERSSKPGVEAHSTQQLSEADWGVPLRGIQQVAPILWAATGVYFLRPGVCFLTCAGRGCLG